MNPKTLHSTLCSALSILALLAVFVGDSRAQVAATAEHEVLKQDVGTWDATVKLWMHPDAPPMEFSATETNELIGNVWLTSRLEANVLENSIIAITTLGYDPTAKQYVSTFIVNLDPHLSNSTGSYDAESRTLTMTGDMRDPTSGEISKTETTSRMLNDETRVTKTYVIKDDGNDWKLFEIRAKRRK